jgi:predicted enzyme related to lactoylglutathione lyase
MTTTTKHAPGTFCWPELATTDQEAAKKFYGGLFGWTFTDTSMGTDAGVYTSFKLQGKDVAAAHTVTPEMQKAGVPPHWGAYVAVASADQAAKQAAALGGKVLFEPFDVMGTLGRMAILQDPTGATFSVWQAMDHPGVGILDEPGSLCWTELMTRDPAGAESFYKALIGWKSESMPMGEMGTYTVFKRGDGQNAAGMMKIPDNLTANVPPNWLSYFLTKDIKATSDKVKTLGGQVMVPPTPIPNVGTFAVVCDPQGATFGLLQSA